MKTERYYCIIQTLPDGTNYYCGISKITLPGNQTAIGMEWSLKENDAELYLTEQVARKILEQVIKENEFALVSIVYKQSNHLLNNK